MYECVCELGREEAECVCVDDTCMLVRNASRGERVKKKTPLTRKRGGKQGWKPRLLLRR